jgi:uncharacterized membrane protein
VGMRRVSLLREKTKIIILCCIYLFILVVQVMFFRPYLWFDTAYSVLYAKQPVSEIVKVNDVHPPLYYLVLHSWIWLFGDNVQVMSLLSVVFGFFSFILLYKIWMHLFKDKSFVWFAAFFMLATTPLYYFGEQRMYVMALFFCLVSFYSLLNFSQKKYKFMFVVSTALLPYIHYFTAFFVMFELSYCLMEKEWRTIKYWIISFVLMTPIFLYFFNQLARIQTLGFQKSSFTSVLSTYYYAWFYSWGGSVALLNTILGIIFITMMFFLIVQYIDVIVDKKEKRLSLLMLAWFILPTVILMIINSFVMNLYHHRFFFFVAWFFIFLSARAIYILKDRTWTKVIVVFLVAFMTLNFVQYELETERDIGEVIAFFNEQNCSGAVSIVHETQASALIHIYYNEQHGCYKNYLYTDLSQKQLNGIGVNAIPDGRILRTQGDLESLGSFYMLSVRHRPEDPNLNFLSLLNSSGAEITLVTHV